MPETQFRKEASSIGIGAGAVVRTPEIPLFFYGSLLGLSGLTIYYVGILLSIVRLVLHLGEPFRAWTATIIWWSGLPSTLGVILVAADLALMLPVRRLIRMP